MEGMDHGWTDLEGMNNEWNGMEEGMDNGMIWNGMEWNGME